MNNNSSQSEALCTSVPSVSHQAMRNIFLAYGGFPEPLDANSCWPATPLTESDSWGSPFPNSGGFDADDAYRDLWHAAYNSNGYFTFFQDGGELVDKIKTYFSSISTPATQFGSVAISQGSLSENTLAISAHFDLGSNQGTITANRISPMPDKEPSLTKAWEIGGGVPHARGKAILSFDPETAQGFALPNSAAGASAFSDAQFQRLFPGAALADKPVLMLDFVQGLYQDYLGPSIASNLMFVGNPNGKARIGSAGINQTVFDQSYQEFVKDTQRAPMVYIASNDGRMHGFQAETGENLITFLPDIVLSEKFAMRQPGVYQPFLDGHFNVSDVFFADAKQWRTVLIGGMRLGGQGFFALDITAPTTFEASSVLWEFTDRQDQDLGFSYSKPAVGRFANGRWLAVLAGGYNNTVAEGGAAVSTTGEAVLYLVDIETGNLIRKLGTGLGMAQDPTGANRPNGFSEPVIVDVDGDSIIDRIYVGDFFGNLFAYDLSAADALSWKSAYGTPANPQPFVASSVTQHVPITMRPIVTPGLTDQELLVIIGTGEKIASGSYNPSMLAGFYDRGEAVTSLAKFEKSSLKKVGQNWQIESPEVPSTPEGESAAGWSVVLDGAAIGLTVVMQPRLVSGELIWALYEPAAASTGPTNSCQGSSGKSHLLT